MINNKARKLPFDPDVFWPASILIGIGALAFGFELTWIWIAVLIVLITILTFFRDPPRRVPQIPGAIVSPADGKVTEIFTNQDPEAGPVGGPCVSIFLSVLNVHVNRAPFDGVVEDIRYRPGKFLNAMSPESGKVNESNWIHMKTGTSSMSVRQISGLIARRIVCRVREGQTLRRGQRVGLIRFGSRTELYLPPNARLQVEIGQNVKGGSSIIAYLPETDAPATTETEA